MSKTVTQNIKIEGATLVKKNFSGDKKEYNQKGDRNFLVLLDPDAADALARDGWPIKHFKAKEDDPDGFEQPFMKVKVFFGKFPPTAVLITSRGKKSLDEDTIGQLDFIRYKNIDLIIRPYNYPGFNGHPAGISAYLKAIYVTVDEDDLELKYADIPELEDGLPF